MRDKLALLILILLSFNVYAQVHTSYLWHMQQPIYWPEQSQSEPEQYQAAWESHFLKTNGGNIYPDGKAHPLNDLEEIFSKDDRKAAYQYRPKESVETLLGFADAGAQVNYSGCLIENVNSLANAGQWGYGLGWQDDFITARNWQTSGGKPRMDVVGFTFHHAIAPLVSEKVLKKEIQAHRYIYQQTFGSSPDYSKGFWPAECSFSERIIKVLVDEGFEWSVIANSHLARTMADYPLSFGTAGCNIDTPNGADKVSTIGMNWWSGQIDGRGGTFAAPYCYQAHKAQYVDPETGSVSKITVVPMDDVLSYMNGYALMGTGEIDAHIAPFDDPQHPSIVLLAHDGDNAWGGGYDYYQNSVPQFAQACANQGYVPSTLQQFLANNSVPEDDVVRVEDGSWVNAANDWGHPQFINWLWPMYTQNYEFNPEGWTEDARNWAVLVAAENHVQMAEDLTGNLLISDIVEPNASSPKAAKAWHRLLPGYTSGYMYYGTSLDMEVKQTLAANLAVGFADEVINENSGIDDTPPSVFIPQRYPYNPGGIGFGPNYGYQQHQNSSDFTVWTFAYDVSGLQNVVLKYRLDEDGVNPLADHANDTYAGGDGVGDWIDLAMESRLFPAGNVTNNPDIDFFIMPEYMAYQYWAEISGLSDTLVDYYIEATDILGNVYKTPIQHVYVGANSPGGQGNISWTPEEPDNEDVITIVIENATQGAKLHWGVNGFNEPVAAYWPEGSYLVGDPGSAIESPFVGPNGQNQLIIQIGPFNNPAQDVYSIGFVIHYDDDTWDNNNGQDFYINIGPGGNQGVQWLPSQPTQQEIITITVNQANVGAKLHWGLNGWNSPDAAYWPDGSSLFGGGGPAVESPMTGPNGLNQLTIQLGPFNMPVQEVTVVDFVIHYDDGSWDNNNGQDYHIIISQATEVGVIAGAVISSINTEFLSGAEITAFDGENTFSGISNDGIGGDLNYLLPDVTPGTYEISCTKAGYITQTLGGIEVSGGIEYTIVDFDLELDTQLPPGWEIVVTPNTHSISIPLVANPQFEGNPLEAGDFIGVFYLDEMQEEKCGGAIQWLGEDIVLTAFGDDSFTTEKDGFSDGEQFVWKVFIQQQVLEANAEVTYNPAMPNHDGMFYTNGLSQILSLEAEGVASQMFYIPQGWSGISSFVDPLYGQVEEIFGPFGADFTILSTSSGFYYPASGINTIGIWDYHDGYSIKVEDNLTLNMDGMLAHQLELTLNEGWNLLPVSVVCEVDTEEAFGGLQQVNIIKEIAGTKVFWPGVNVATLTELEPGKAYWISLSEGLSFSYPDCLETVYVPSPPGEVFNPTSWNDVHCTPISHLISMPGTVITEAGLQVSDVVGVFTLEGKCAGSIELSNTNDIAITAFADDELTADTDGFVSYEPMKFKVFRTGNNEEFNLDIEFDPTMSEQGSFAANGLSAIINASLVPNTITETISLSFQVFPNPNSGNFTILCNEHAAYITHIEILDLTGSLVQTFINDLDNVESIELNLQKLQRGIYFVKLYTETSVGFEKIIYQ
jgi:hypothetical protein